jgi:hypothetical protein
MIILVRYRFPRLGAVLGVLSGFITLGIALACHASPAVIMLGGGSSLIIAAVRFIGRRKQLGATNRVAR